MMPKSQQRERLTGLFWVAQLSKNIHISSSERLFMIEPFLLPLKRS